MQQRVREKKLDLPENGLFRLTIEPVEEEKQETLADVLGFDPNDEEKAKELAEKQHRAFEELMVSLDGLPGSKPPHDGSINHDKYIYRIDLSI
ncbi:MAG: hypothetical protein ACUVV0_04260 [Anaerolineae bacterium]